MDFNYCAIWVVEMTGRYFYVSWNKFNTTRIKKHFDPNYTYPSTLHHPAYDKSSLYIVTACRCINSVTLSSNDKLYGAIQPP